MSSSMQRLVSRIPKVSLRGVAYVAAANFMARSVILIRSYITTYFHSEMVLLYGATLDTRILLFFQSIYMIPMFLLGVLIFCGIERESFNLVLYPTLMLIFLILIRYGSETALLVVHWEDHKFNQTPELLFFLLQDVIFIALLLLYVYMCLAFTAIKPTPRDILEGGGGGAVSSPPQQQLLPSTSSQDPNQNPPPDSQRLSRNVGVLLEVPKDSIAKLEEVVPKARNSLLGWGGAMSKGVIETDLDAVPTPATTASESTASVVVAPTPSEPTPEASPVVTVKPPKQLKKRAFLAKKASLESAEAPPPPVSEPEKPVEPPPTVAEPEVDFWGSVNGDALDAKPDGPKTTSV